MERTYDKLIAKIRDCRKEIEFWSPDLTSPDDDEVAEARKFIRAAKKQLQKAEIELMRLEIERG